MIGVEILQNFLINAKNFSLDLGYIKYKRIVLSISQMGLPAILEPTMNLLKQAMADQLQNQQNIGNSLWVFEKLSALLYECLSFTFNFSYIDFENEWGLNENLIIRVRNKIFIIYINKKLLQYPENFSNFFHDYEFFSKIFEMFRILYFKSNQASLIVVIIIFNFIILVCRF